MQTDETIEGMEPDAEQVITSDPGHAPDSYPIEDVVADVRAGKHAHVTGATGGLTAVVIADLARRLDRPTIVLVEDPKEARNLAAELSLYLSGDVEGDLTDDVALYPEYDVGPYHGATADRATATERLTTLFKLSGAVAPVPRITVASLGAAVRKTVRPEDFEPWVRTLKFGDEATDEDLRALFTACGYTEVPLVEDRGTFAIRGDIADVFSPFLENPVRIERWGDEVSELRAFDATSQRTIGEVEACPIFPIREEILAPEVVRPARERLQAHAASQGLQPTEIANMMSDLAAGLHFVGIDALLPVLYEGLADLFDWAPDDALVVALEPEKLVASHRELLDKRRAEFQLAQSEDAPAFPPEEYYRDELDADFAVQMRRLGMDRGEEGHRFRARQNADIVAIRKHHRGVEETVAAVVEKIRNWKEDFGRICIVCRTRGQVERLEHLLESHGETPLVVPPPIDVSEPVPPPAGVIELYRGELGEGFRSELLSLAVISGVELFGMRVVTTTTRDFGDQVAISHFRDLTAGDLVVHIDFGIGRYLGLVHLEVQGFGADFLHIEYADGDTLYLPVYRLGRVQRYIGVTDGVRLDKLGGTSWERTKERVKKEIREVAGDLLELYARRELRKGYAFSPPDGYYHEFEAAFPYEETPDQARAIDDVIDDMTRPRPMDRLICGDVGFGKTEVAIRGAMKAVLDGKQVAVLVPTTILAEQHIVSFRNRVAEFGVRVEGLSRFRTTKQSREILAHAAEGKVDILVGTHRLLSNDVEFRDLGLLVVDEEQRFGVQHKEKIKKLKANVDVLTLSATPIPRTLQMSLLGIRDLSIIATPPHARLAVRTHVAKFNDALIREAVMRELSRGGQVFFVHNRVQTIEEMKQHLEKVVPEARIAVAHGQMKEKELEDVMYGYIQGDTHVLLCTAIIESGLDIPNANTIIVNRADNFGLSQLYQLRGRVGRGRERAFAYLMIPARTKLKPDAEKRLEVIQTHTELGSGFQVATYDLEIRGAGNLLGEDQSGHVAAVGLDLYTELLEETIDEMRGEDGDADLDPEVNVAIEAFIPDDYIQATSLRLMFYKRFSLSRTEDELYDTFGELGDRFGEPPQPVHNLREIIRLKLGLRDIRGTRLDIGPSTISIALDQSTPVKPNLLLEWLKEQRGRMRLTKDMKVVWNLLPAESAEPLASARALIAQLNHLR